MRVTHGADHLQVKAIKVLLTLGADPLIKDNRGRSCLHYSPHMGDIKGCVVACPPCEFTWLGHRSDVRLRECVPWHGVCRVDHRAVPGRGRATSLWRCVCLCLPSCAFIVFHFLVCAGSGCCWM